MTYVTPRTLTLRVALVTLGACVLCDCADEPGEGWAPDPSEMPPPVAARLKDGFGAAIDGSFGREGVVYFRQGLAPYVPGSTSALDVGPDGSIFVGDGRVLLRLSPDGAVDRGFGHDGVALGPDRFYGYVFARQPDGKLVIAGGANEQFPNGVSRQGVRNAVFLMRLLADGTVDRSFGAGGVATVGFPSHVLSAAVTGLAVTRDGHVVGSGWWSETYDSYNDLLFRLGPDGALDASFNAPFGYATRQQVSDGGSTGELSFSHGLGTGRLLRPLLRPGGSIDVVGTRAAAPGDPWAAAGHADFLLARYGRDGLPQLEFGTEGTIYTNHASEGKRDNFAAAVAEAAGGKLVVAGMTLSAQTPNDSGVSVVARHLPDGALDPSFGDGGILGFRVFEDRAEETELLDLAVLADDSIVIVGQSFNAVSPGLRSFLVRILPEGRLDPAFGRNGVLSRFPDVDINRIVRQPDGKLLVGCGVRGGRAFVMRLNAL